MGDRTGIGFLQNTMRDELYTVSENVKVGDGGGSRGECVEI
jgi:hypothetical protein